MMYNEDDGTDGYYGNVGARKKGPEMMCRAQLIRKTGGGPARRRLYAGQLAKSPAAFVTNGASSSSQLSNQFSVVLG